MKTCDKVTKKVYAEPLRYKDLKVGDVFRWTDDPSRGTCMRLVESQWLSFILNRVFPINVTEDNHRITLFPDACLELGRRLWTL